MPFRFHKSIKIAPGIRMNIGKHGFSSVNIGKTNFGKRGVFHSFDIPGTGLSYRAQIAGGSVFDALSGAGHAPASAPALADLALSLHDDGTIVFKDKDGHALSEPAAEAEKKQNHDAIAAWLDAQAASWNGGIEALIALYLTTPAPSGDVTIRPDGGGQQEAEQALKTDPEVMSAALKSAFATISWPRETNVSFEVTPDGHSVLLDVDLPEIQDMPDKMATVDRKALKLNIVARPAGQIQIDYLKHIHAIGFRLIGEVFAHLPAVAMVVFSGYSQRVNPQTGNSENDYLYSARVAREKWQQINFGNLAQVDVVACFEAFELRRKATKAGVISPIEPFEK